MDNCKVGHSSKKIQLFLAYFWAILVVFRPILGVEANQKI